MDNTVTRYPIGNVGSEISVGMSGPNAVALLNGHLLFQIPLVVPNAVYLANRLVQCYIACDGAQDPVSHVRSLALIFAAAQSKNLVPELMAELKSMLNQVTPAPDIQQAPEAQHEA